MLSWNASGQREVNFAALRVFSSLKSKLVGIWALIEIKWVFKWRFCEFSVQNWIKQTKSVVNNQNSEIGVVTQRIEAPKREKWRIKSLKQRKWRK